MKNLWSRASAFYAIGIVPILAVALFACMAPSSYAYPPAVGITGKYRNCIACHTDSGNWKDDENNVIDIIDKETKKSLKQKDGTFLISAKRGEAKTVLTVLGRAKEDKEEAPRRTAWTYVDPNRIEDDTVGPKFPIGWCASLPMSCRYVGDELKGFEGAKVTVLPMTIRPTDEAKDSEVELQVLLVRGEVTKGDPNKGLIQNYFGRKVALKIEK